MLNGRMEVRFFKGASIVLFVVLLGSVKLIAQQQPLASECEKWESKAKDLDSVIDADLVPGNRAIEKWGQLNETLKTALLRLQVHPEESEQIARASLVVLSDLKQTRVDMMAAWKKYQEDARQQKEYQRAATGCFARLVQPRSTGPASYAITLTVFDRTQTVNVTLNNDRFQVTHAERQGIALPSRDPAASNTTGPVKVSRQAVAMLRIDPPLPEGWSAWLGIDAVTSTPRGAENICGPTKADCEATSGPYPGVRRGYGKGWAAGESAEVWLCHGPESCLGRMDPVALININWVLP